MPKLSFERGNFSRVILGLVVCLIFAISALTSPADRRNDLFMLGIGIILTWQQYSLYLIKKQEKKSEPEENRDQSAD